MLAFCYCLAFAAAPAVYVLLRVHSLSRSITVHMRTYRIAIHQVSLLSYPATTMFLVYDSSDGEVKFSTQYIEKKVITQY